MTPMSRYLFLGRKEAEFYSQKSRKRAERGGSYEREDDELLEDAVSSEHSVKHAKAFRYV